MFRIEKLVQVAGHLLKLNNFKMNYLKVIKILYLADRESINRTGQSITGDSFVSMKNGPVLNKLYELIKNKYNSHKMQDFWNTRFSTDGYDLIANFDRIPDGLLSSFEKKTIEGLSEQFKDTAFGDMIKYVHEICPEWEETDTSIPISIEHILECLGRTPEEIECIMAENEAFDKEEYLFSSLRA